MDRPATIPPHAVIDAAQVAQTGLVGPWGFGSVLGVLSLLVATFVGPGCSEDNPAAPGDGAVCVHFDADGVVLEHDGAPLVAQWEGLVVGEVGLAEGGSIALSVTFLDPDSLPGAPGPACTDQVLDVQVADDSVVRAVLDAPDGRWSFRLEGLSAGETSIRVRILHADHPDFTSLALPVRVVPVPVPESVLVREGANPICFWNYDPARGPDTVQGGIVVEESTVRTPLTIAWLGTYDDEEVNDKRPEIPFVGGGYAMAWTVADEGTATVSPVAGQDWQVGVTGVSVGTTTVEFRLLREGEIVLHSGPLPIEVVVDPGASAVQDHYLNLGGAWTVIVVGGETVAEGCDRSANPGAVLLDVGESSALYKITLLDGICTKIQLDSNYEYRFRFSRPDVARIVQAPIHWGENQVFHVEGIASGSADLSVYLFHEGVFLWKSPPYPVEVG